MVAIAAMGSGRRTATGHQLGEVHSDNAIEAEAGQAAVARLLDLVAWAAGDWAALAERLLPQRPPSFLSWDGAWDAWVPERAAS